MTDRSPEPETERADGVGQLGAAAIRGSTRRLRSPPWLARAASGFLCASSIGFVAAFGVVLGSGGELALVTKPLPVRAALALPYAVLLSTIATVVGAGLALWKRYWSPIARVHQATLALLGITFCWQLGTLGFLG